VARKLLPGVILGTLAAECLVPIHHDPRLVREPHVELNVRKPDLPTTSAPISVSGGAGGEVFAFDIIQMS